MLNNKFVKIEKISEGQLNEVGLPVYEYVWVQHINLVFEEQVWFSGNAFNDILFEEHYREYVVKRRRNTIGSSAGIYAHWSTPTTPPDEKDSLYYTENIDSRTDREKLINKKTFKKYFICGYEVTEQEMNRVASLVGCHL